MGPADVGEQVSEVHRCLSFRTVSLSLPYLGIYHVIFLDTVWLRLIFFQRPKHYFLCSMKGHISKVSSPSLHMETLPVYLKVHVATMINIDCKFNRSWIQPRDTYLGRSLRLFL